MRLIIFTQVVDVQDPVLGFFHGWLSKLATVFESVEVICLYEGTHMLPPNVHVHSLGKEQGRRSRLAYAVRALWHAWRLRSRYDAVFVHQNQEYVLIAGWLWLVLRKPIHLWRNHWAGSWLTDIAASMCTKVYCTSKASYTARYKKTRLMPVGVDTDVFQQKGERAPRSILSLGRIAPSKRIDMLIDALRRIAPHATFTAAIYGDALEKDAGYAAKLQQSVRDADLAGVVTFSPGVPNTETPAIYGAHEIFVNLSASGMYDKTIFEAAACGCVVLAASKDYAAEAGEGYTFSNADELAHALERVLALDEEERRTVQEKMRTLARVQSLSALIDRLCEEIV